MIGLLNNHTGEPLDRLEAEKLVEGIRDYKELDHRLMLIVGLSSGISNVELSQITSDTINYQNQIINIWDKWQNRHRSVYVSKNVLNLLKDYENELTDKHFFPYSLDSIEKMVIKHSEEILGVKKTWLAIRRTYVKLCVEVDMPLSIVIENTGQKPENIFKWFAKKNLNPINEVNGKELFRIRSTF